MIFVKKLSSKFFKIIAMMIILIIATSCNLPKDQSKKYDLLNNPMQVRFIRIFADNDESKPPVLILNSEKNKYPQAINSNKLRIEMDIDANVPPAMYVRFVHCDINWEETQNTFLQDAIGLKTSNINWQTAPYLNGHYSYRAIVDFPSSTVQFKFSGNWLAKFYLYGNEEKEIASVKFFVVEPKAMCNVYLSSDFYDVLFNSSNSAFNIEAVVNSNENLFDTRIHTAIMYKNQRWFEPYIISQESRVKRDFNRYKYDFPIYISGFSSIEKRFQLRKLPTENVYRLMRMTNTADFPRVTGPVRIPFIDIRRNGNYFERDFDGAMNSEGIVNSTDDYVYVEFVLDPEDVISKNDVFISGSFNNWNPNKDWQMYYDEESRYYILRNWVRRGNHNYLYGTGKFNIDKQTFEKISYDEYEGNTYYTNHSYVTFIYYREIDYGGYDAIIAVGAGNIYGNIKR